MAPRTAPLSLALSTFYPPVITDSGLMMLCSTTSMLFAVNLTSNDVAFTYTVDASIATPPALLNDSENSLIVGDANGFLYKFSHDLSILWKVAFSSPVTSAVLAHPSAPTIFVGVGPRLFVLDSITGAILSIAQLSGHIVAAPAWKETVGVAVGTLTGRLYVCASNLNCSTPVLAYTGPRATPWQFLIDSTGNLVFNDGVLTAVSSTGSGTVAWSAACTTLGTTGVGAPVQSAAGVFFVVCSDGALLSVSHQAVLSECQLPPGPAAGQ